MEELLNSLNKVNTTLEESLRITNENVAYTAAETTSIKQKLASMSVETRNALDKLVKSATHTLTIGKEKLSRSDTMLNVLKTIKTNSDMNAKVGNGNTKVLNKILSNSSNLQDNIRTTLSYPLKALNSRIGVLAGSINGAFKTFKSSIANTTGAVISTVKSAFGKFGKTLSSLATIHGAIGLLGHAMLSSIKIGGRYGFVSSHAANSFAVALFTSLLFRRRLYTWTIFLWATANVYTRIYLGVHYPLDILGGAIVGLACGWLSFYVMQRIKPQLQRRMDDILLDKHIYLIISVLIISVAVIAIGNKFLLFLA